MYVICCGITQPFLAFILAVRQRSATKLLFMVARNLLLRLLECSEFGRLLLIKIGTVLSRFFISL